MSVGTVGATRNRTDLFLKYRTKARGGTGLGSKTADSGATKLLAAALNSTTADNGDVSIQMADLGAAGVASMLPPQYVDFKEQIRTEMFSIKQKMNELRSLHGKATLTTFDDADGSEAGIEVLTQDITRLFRKCESRLQQFGKGPSSSEADEKVKQNVQRTLAVELQRLSVTFRKQQKAYLSRLRAKDGAGGFGGSSSSFALLEDRNAPGMNDPDDVDPGFSEIQAMKVDSMGALAEERDREVTKILQSIHDLAQIMKDLSVLVIDQGTILDRIDYNMEQVATKVDEGVKELVKAEKKQRQSRSVLCIIFLVCAVVVMLLIVVFKNIIKFV